MIPEAFEYHAPGTVAEALELLAKLPDAKLLAGGMSLIPAMKHRLMSAGSLIDLGRISELARTSERRGRLEIGACVTHADLIDSDAVAGLDVLSETAAVIGDVQVRNRGTFGGSLVHADPAADWPAAFLALEGEASVLGGSGERTVAAADFFVGMLTSAVAEGEILTAVRLPVERKRTGTAYRKLRQPASGFAVVGVAARLSVDRRGRVDRAGIGVTGVNAVPFRAQSLEARLEGEALDPSRIASLCSEIDECDPMEDLHASAEYRRHLAGVYASRAIADAYARAAA